MRPLLFALAVALSGPALGNSTDPLPTLSLTGGAGVTVPKTGHRLLLTGLVDQRCPAQVDCYWEGMIRAEITVMPANGAAQQIILCNLCDDGTRDATVAGLTISLVGLAPSTEDLARLGRAPLLTDYTLTVAYSPAP